MSHEHEDPRRRFYLEHHEKLWNFVLWRVRDKHDAEDVCQEIWRSFFVEFDEYVANYEPPTMALYPIARCRVTDYWRRYGRIREEPVEGEDLLLLADSLNARTRPAEDADRRMDLEQALTTLPSRQCEALHLHYIDGLTVPETARLMGISGNAVNNLLKKARRTLRRTDSLDSYGPWEERE